MKLYPIVDFPKHEDWKSVTGEVPSFDDRMKLRHHLRAVSTGEFRPPRKGEWYLSGAIVEAYRAPNDLSTPFQIARLVLTETKITTVIKQKS